MNTPGENNNKVISYAIQLLALAILILFCFRILENFVTPMVWGSVLAIALYPLHNLLTKKLRGRNVWSASIITALMLLLMIGPGVWLLVSTVGEFKELTAAYRAGEYSIPPPPAKVKDWPVIGTKANELWTQASTNLTGLVQENKEQLKTIAVKLMSLLASAGKGLLMFTLSIIVAGVLLVYSKGAGEFAQSFFVKLAGKHGEDMTQVTKGTVQNVTKGILGVAMIQSTLAGIGFIVAGVPLAGLWILICLVLSTIQVGIMPVSVGVIIYIWGAAEPLTATLLTIWMILVGISDNVLRPILMGKGAPAPMLIIFIGSLGGFMTSGFIGLFTGAIVLSLGYKLFIGWLNTNETPEIS